MGAEERGACERAGATGVPQHIQRDDLKPTSIMDRRAVERYLQFSERRCRVIELDGRIYQRPVYAPSGSKGQILGGRLPEQQAA